MASMRTKKPKTLHLESSTVEDGLRSPVPQNQVSPRSIFFAGSNDGDPVDHSPRRLGSGGDLGPISQGELPSDLPDEGSQVATHFMQFVSDAKASSSGVDQHGREGSKSSAEKIVGPALDSPGASLFSIASGEEGKLAKLFSWGRRKSSLNNTGAADSEDKAKNDGGRLLKRTSSMLPPNYSAVFVDRTPRLTIVQKRSQWALEMVTSCSNGVRQELRDMYKILDDMERRPLTLTTDDMDVFFGWFGTFGEILKVIFDLEESCLYAWVEGRDKMSSEELKWCPPPDSIKGELSEGRRMRKKGMVLQHLSSTMDFSSETFAGRPVAERLPSLAETLDSLVCSLLEYLEIKETELPRIILEKNLTQRDRRRYEHSYWSSLQHAARRDTDLANLVIVSVSRWMGRRAKSRWRRKHLHGMSRREYAQAQRNYYQNHYAAVKELEARVAFDEVERNRLAAENAVLRARAEAVGDWPSTSPKCFDDESLQSESVTSSVR